MKNKMQKDHPQIKAQTHCNKKKIVMVKKTKYIISKH